MGIHYWIKIKKQISQPEKQEEGNAKISLRYLIGSLISTKIVNIRIEFLNKHNEDYRSITINNIKQINVYTGNQRKIGEARSSGALFDIKVIIKSILNTMKYSLIIL